MTSATISQLASQPALPVSNVMLDGTQQVGVSVQKLVIESKPGQHETATLTLMATELDVTRYRDRPVIFDWGLKGTVERFSGYITKVAKPQQFQSQPNLVLTATGPSWVMANGKPRYWVNQKSETIAAEAVARHGLRLVFDDHWYTWRAFCQTGESDWGLLQKVAMELGYLIFSYRGVIRMIDPVKVLNQQRPVATITKSSNILDGEQGLLSFEPAAVSDNDRSVQKLSFGWLMPDGTPQVVNPGGNYTESYIPDGENARLAAEVLDRATSYWTQAATARVRGRTDIYPGATVNIGTGGSASISDAYDGQWLVIGLTHSIDSSAFATELYLVRNQVQSSVQATRPAQFWNQARQPRPKLTLINGAWVDGR